MGSQSPSAGARPITHTTTPPAYKLPDIHLDIVLVVFCGGTIGTAIRYAFAQIPAAGSFHTGTFVANMLACFCYAGLTAYLAGASRFGARSKELASRGLGMAYAVVCLRCRHSRWKVLPQSATVRWRPALPIYC